MQNEKQADVLTEEELTLNEKALKNSSRAGAMYATDYNLIEDIIDSHRTLNSRNAKLINENDELMAENEKLRNILIKLHAHMDFAEPIENNEPISYTDASGINAVFEEAFKALEELNHE